MATAWTATALTRLLALLQADATLSAYVDAFEITDRLRDDEAPDFTRHALQLCPESVSLAPHSVSTNDETFAVRCRMWIAPWTSTRSALLTSNTVSGVGSGGTGGSEVGLLQFLEDVANAVRKTGLPDTDGHDLVEQTALEAGSVQGLSVPGPDGQDKAFLVQDFTITFLRVAYHDPLLR